MVMKTPGGSEDTLQQGVRWQSQRRTTYSMEPKAGVAFTWLSKTYLFRRVSFSPQHPNCHPERQITFTAGELDATGKWLQSRRSLCNVKCGHYY